MPTQRIEPVSAGLTLSAAVLTYIADAMKWLSDNAAAISAIVVMVGLTIQFASSRRNAAKLAAEELRAQAEERRAQEEHDLKMKILRGELPDRRAVVAKVDAVEV